MKKELKIRVREDLCIETDILKNARFVDCGASKSTFVIGETCYKIPIGYELLDSNSFTKICKYPYECDDFDFFIHNVVAEECPELVWSIGQIIFEIMVWEHLKELEQLGYDISGFAEIKDYYIDKNGIPVIEQEFIHSTPEITKDKPYVSGALFNKQNRRTLAALEDMDFCLTDLRDGNMAYNMEGKLKCFDFGISNGNAIYNYDSYEEWNSYHNSYYNSDEDKMEYE